MATEDAASISGADIYSKRIAMLRGGDYLAILLRGRYIVLGTVLFFMVLAIVARFVLPAKYEASTVLLPNASEPEFSNPLLGNLMKLGFMSGGGAGGKRSAAIATLQSRSFLEQMITTEKLEPVLLPARWDADTKSWKGAPPSLEECYNVLAGAIYVDTTPTDLLIKLRVRWTDPDQAVWIANHMVAMLNHNFQQKAVVEADRMIAFLNESYRDTSIEDVRSSLANLIVDQMKERILAKSRDDYALTVVDPAERNSQRVSPGLAIMLPAALFLGLMFGIPLAFLWHVYAPSWSGPVWRNFSIGGARWRTFSSR